MEIPPNEIKGSHCNGCGFKEHCQSKFLNDIYTIPNLYVKIHGFAEHGD